MPYGELPAFMDELRQRDGVAARALEFCILTAARSGEVRHANWAEVDLDAKVWTVPASRMKARREHRVPLSESAIAILSALPRNGARVFEGHTAHMALLKVLQRMGRGDVTTHGFRATFKTWAGERTNFANETVEIALAHRIGNNTEQAYERGDKFEKRRRLMDAWADFCTKPAASGKVVAISKHRRR